MKSTNQSKRTLFFLLGLIAFHAVCNVVYLNKDVFSWYPEKYYQLIYKNYILERLASILHSDASWIDRAGKIVALLNTGFGWPSLVHLYTASLNLLFGNTLNISVLSHLPFLAVLITMTFLIGKKLANAWTGLFAAFLLSFYPGIFGISRSYGLDLPLAAAVTAAIYLLIRTRHMHRLKEAALIGLVMGAGTLVKGSFLFYVAGPLLYIFHRFAASKILRSLSRRGKIPARPLKTLSGLLIAGGVALAVSALWWSGHLAYFREYARQVAATNTLDIALLSSGKESFRRPLYYLIQTIFLVSPLTFLLFCLYPAVLLKKRPGSKSAEWMVLLWALVPYLILTFIGRKRGFYYLPSLPAIALLTALAWRRLSPARWKTIFWAAASLFLCIQFFDLSFASRILPRKFFYPQGVASLAPAPTSDPDAGAVRRFIDVIHKTGPANRRRDWILLAGTPALIDTGRMEYIFREKTSDVRAKNFWEERRARFEDWDYLIVVNEGEPPPEKKSGAPDLRFLATYDFETFFRHNYPQVKWMRADLQDFPARFSKFPVIDSFYSGDRSYYLCKISDGRR